MFDFSDKFATIGLAAALAVAVIGNVGQWLHTQRLNSQIATLDRQINDPNTGFVAKLTTCKANTQELQSAIDTQNASTAINAAKEAATLAEATATVAEANTASDKAQERAEGIMAPIGEGDVCSQILTLDERLMESVQ
ncbi:hypothetical protein [Alterisphingorhabdus coralli]|uniref:Uncharacterized protein n=1 Tax=Alterisphingorhabdus coralli TaxID=3071408 RepID=A0AA97FB14_9SPHN|nr:hypothetical protein [Parasphingorhabdus sp. SCSIO 66989]WOE76332.1 hypothetical protein RB602_06365 [Parasphingorhabdus sp. SCSIO 66989]